MKKTLALVLCTLGGSLSAMHNLATPAQAATLFTLVNTIPATPWATIAQRQQVITACRALSRGCSHIQASNHLATNIELLDIINALINIVTAQRRIMDATLHQPAVHAIGGSLARMRSTRANFIADARRRQAGLQNPQTHRRALQF